MSDYEAFVLAINWRHFTSGNDSVARSLQSLVTGVANGKQALHTAPRHRKHSAECCGTTENFHRRGFRIHTDLLL
jgi:hypothetical protein